jgi:hypothetical protein
MPNWCINDITITGPSDKISKIYYDAIEKNGLLEAMVPIGDWDYNTALESWGTKWDVDPEFLELVEDEGTVMIVGTFDSAWAPPIQAFETFLEKNPDCEAEIQYFEPGMGYVGKFEGGEEEYYEYDISDRSSLDNIPDDLIEHFNVEGEFDNHDEMDFDEEYDD